jgi:hypothetical protein
MSGINTQKVITGGLLAGLVFNILDFLTNAYILGTDFAANATRLGLDPNAFGSSAIVATVIIDFLSGILAVFIYAAIRPRFGPGPKTAFVAAVILWMNVALVMYIVSQSGVFTMALYWKTSVLQLISATIGTVAGAWAYKEA